MSDVFFRRQFLQIAAGGVAAGIVNRTSVGSTEGRLRTLDGAVGITTGGLNHQRESNELTALTLPTFMREELGMQMIDLNTRWLNSFDESYIQKVRAAAEDAQCFFTNLKVNHKFGDLYSKDTDERKYAMTNARALVNTAQTLGTRWIRFVVPKFAAGDDKSKLHAHRNLALFAEQHNVQLLVENLGWLQSDPNSIVRVVKAIGENVAACPDTGNWDDNIRYAALGKSFPGAASCDFKVFDLDAKKQHAMYDVRRCFEIGRKAGYRGPWVIEHWNKDTKAFARETVYLRDQLKKWMAATA